MGNVFVAITLDDDVRERLRPYDAAVLDAAPRTRLVRSENRHITLAFLGETPRLDDAREALAAVNASAFELLIGGFGTFGRGSRQVLWVGVDRSPEIVACERAVRAAFERRNFTLPERAFTPHITLARGWNRKAAVPLDELRAAVQPLTMAVDRLSLLQTDHEDGHTVYRTLAERELVPESEADDRR